MIRSINTPEALARKADLNAELQRILPIIIDHYQPEKIILFGSLATDQVHEWSDIDLAILKENIPQNYLERLFEFKKLIDADLATDVFIYRPNEFAAKLAENHYFFVDEIFNKGKVIYERGAGMAEFRQ